MPLRFNDGMKFNLDGPMRIERRSDGYYVVGRGMMCPVKDHAEGEAMVKEFAHQDMLKAKE